ncbi:MAG TPA: DUF169 domain-containing protein [bacterium]|jgi:uncharacterized protein (DUF169 family)|nr:DUF169 domain-containing protein [bacterium]
MNSYAEVFQGYLRLKTKPLAVKMLKEGESEPEEAIRPLTDLGHHLSLCQAFSMSRRQGETIALFKEDHWCFEPVLCYGLAEPPQYFLEGHNRYPGTAKTLEAGSRWAHIVPKFTPHEYAGIVSAPLESASFQPDVIILYCDPSQLTQIMIAVNWIDGNDVISQLSGHAACVYAVVPVVQNNQFQIVVPCMGDRTRAFAQDSEMIFSLPGGKAKDLIEALEFLEDSGQGYPIKYSLGPEYPLSDSYNKIGRLMGMDLPRDKPKP